MRREEVYRDWNVGKFAKLAVILRIGETLRTSERTNDSLGGRRRSETEADALALGLGHERARAREGGDPRGVEFDTAFRISSPPD